MKLKKCSQEVLCRPDPGDDDVNLRRRVRLLLKGIKVLSVAVVVVDFGPWV